MSGVEEIIRLAARGDGVTASGRHVAGVAPGDRIDADGTITRGPNHIDAACRHYGRCGGCQLQHVDDAALAEFVRARVANALAGQGLGDVPVETPHLSPPGSRRRAAMRAMRPGKTVLLGYMAAGSHNLVDIAACPVLDPALSTLIGPLRCLLERLMRPRSDVKVALTLAEQGADILLEGVTAEGLEAHDAIFDFCTAHPIARLAIDGGDGPEDRWVPDPVTVRLGGVSVPLPHRAFLQATVDGEAALVAAAVEAVGEADSVADLFSGLGTFAFALTRPGRKITAVEAARDAVLAAMAAARSRGLAVDVAHRDLYRRPLTVTELAGFGAVVLDPPRAGAVEQIAQIAQSAVPVIAYASCNPSTFARDAAKLIGGGYVLDRVKPVGQFRWSTHVELAATFRRR